MTGQFFVDSAAVRPLWSVSCRRWPSSARPVGPITSCTFRRWQSV